ncbi:uncharacterized protein LOC113798893 [Dermatophagoides pteronyssinus]|uniref:uncharacterized protein LOC113798893 n=1 Tax=Dermatophagoides pteronyssinus TaxID=6956 RepID=UPI003F667E8F
MDNKIIKVYCLIIGSNSVGKTTLINKLQQSSLSSLKNYDDYNLTTRINIIRKSYGLSKNEPDNNDNDNSKNQNKRIEIIYIEFPGKEIYQNFLQEFYRKSETSSNDRIIIVIGLFDISNRSSLTIVEKLFNSTTTNKNPHTNHKQSIGFNRIMVANKIDLIDKRIVSFNECQTKSKLLKCRYIECTIRNDQTMQELEQIILDIIKNV